MTQRENTYQFEDKRKKKQSAKCQNMWESHNRKSNYRDKCNIRSKTDGLRTTQFYTCLIIVHTNHLSISTILDHFPSSCVNTLEINVSREHLNASVLKQLSCSWVNWDIFSGYIALFMPMPYYKTQNPILKDFDWKFVSRAKDLVYVIMCMWNGFSGIFYNFVVN